MYGFLIMVIYGLGAMGATVTCMTLTRPFKAGVLAWLAIMHVVLLLAVVAMSTLIDIHIDLR